MLPSIKNQILNVRWGDLSNPKGLDPCEIPKLVMALNHPVQARRALERLWKILAPNRVVGPCSAPVVRFLVSQFPDVDDGILEDLLEILDHFASTADFSELERTTEAMDWTSELASSLVAHREEIAGLLVGRSEGIRAFASSILKKMNQAGVLTTADIEEQSNEES